MVRLKAQCERTKLSVEDSKVVGFTVDGWKAAFGAPSGNHLAFH